MFRERKVTRKGALRADAKFWSALGEGEILKTVLADFYDRVFEDDRLSPFFDGVAKEYVAQKQYGFLRAILTGKDCYFGANPRNAHHWMIIDDELFDYRETLLEECLRRHGVAANWIVRIREIDEVFRKQIVKQEPHALRIGGVTVPLDGLGRIEVSIAFICDGCAAPLEIGDEALYSVKTSATYCIACGTEALSSLLPDASQPEDATEPSE